MAYFPSMSMRLEQLFAWYKGERGEHQISPLECPFRSPSSFTSLSTVTRTACRLPFSFLIHRSVIVQSFLQPIDRIQHFLTCSCDLFISSDRVDVFSHSHQLVSTSSHSWPSLERTNLSGIQRTTSPAYLIVLFTYPHNAFGICIHQGLRGPGRLQRSCACALERSPRYV